MTGTGISDGSDDIDLVHVCDHYCRHGRRSRQAADREALVDAIERTLIRHAGEPVDWLAWHLADVLHASGILLDAALVRHEHGMRIAEAIRANPYRPVRTARDLSPAPEVKP